MAAARAQLTALELIAYEAPLYQVLAMPGAQAWAPRPAPGARALSSPSPATPSSSRQTTGPVSLGDLLSLLERRRARL